MTSLAQDTLTQALIDRYDLVREIGRGGMATVYLAADRKHDRRVAIKVMRPEVATSSGADRFLREVRLVARLQHPHILPLYDSGEAGGLLYFVMPFIEGESLRDLLRREGALTLDECTRVVRQVADALDYAHTRGVVHRDLKPDNVLLVEGQALLADFGVARALEGHDGSGGDPLTSVSMRLGTPAYMSPEQAAGDLSIDRRSDIYGLGCVCYELLAGAPPFQGINAMSVISQHIATRPPMLVGTRALLPAGVNEAVARALAKNPADRFQTAGELATSLERALVEARTPTAADARLRALEQQHQARQAVLVLDFANVAGATDADWLSTGIAETVGADLGKIGGIKVVGQDAVTRRHIEAERQGRAYDGGRAIELGRRLGATWVVWGSFQKFGARIRLIPQFADTRDGTVVSAEKIDGVMDDIFQLQDRIVTGFADLLRIRLSPSEVDQIERPETTTVSAYEHYARGHRAFQRFGKASVKEAAEHFRAAIAIDPKYAPAHSSLGVLHGPMYIASGRREILDEGARILEHALELDPTIGEAYAWLAYLQYRQDRFDDAERTALRGIERDPASAMCWYFLGTTRLSMSVVGRGPAALARCVPPLLRTIAINPDYIASDMALGSAYALRGMYAHATAFFDRAVALEGKGEGFQFVGSLVQRAMLHIGLGELDPAATLLERAIERYSASDHVYAEAMCAYAHFARGTLRERTGGLGEAAADFGRACAIADAHEHRITIGGHWVKGRFGLARVLHHQGRPEDADRALVEGRTMFETRPRFVWTWFYGATDPEILYELAATYATLGQRDNAIDALRRAADASWADVPYLRHDPAFAELRDSEEISRLCADASGRVQLPPPVGSGGVG
jgi:serine/threonine-protein kinase